MMQNNWTRKCKMMELTDMWFTLKGKTLHKVIIRIIFSIVHWLQIGLVEIALKLKLSAILLDQFSISSKIKLLMLPGFIISKIAIEDLLLSLQEFAIHLLQGLLWLLEILFLDVSLIRKRLERSPVLTNHQQILSQKILSLMISSFQLIIFQLMCIFMV